MKCRIPPFGRRIIFAILLLGTLGIGALFFSSDPVPHDEAKSEPAPSRNPIYQISDVPNVSSPDDRQPIPEASPQTHEGTTVELAAADDGWVRQTLSETWMDEPSKLVERRRVRVVDADFKYPRLRFEESVTTNPDTGVETATLLRASVADHLLIGLRDGVVFEDAAAAIRDMGYPIRHIEPDAFILAEIPTPTDARAQERAVLDLAALEEFIDHAEPDYLVFPSLTPNDPAYLKEKMWALHNPGNTAGSLADADIDAPEAWQIRHSAPEIVVAVTDTGIQYNHEDLRDNMWQHPVNGSHGFDAYDNDDDPMDVGGHGTHCAGTIGARGDNGIGITGVAWDVQLMALRFLGPNGGTTSDAVRVINYARQNGADIINASWGGGGRSKSLENAIKACGDVGIPFVASAGNTASNNDAVPRYPSSYSLPNVVSVAATTRMDELSTFSCFGRTTVHLGAPGSAIWSTYTGSDSAYTYLNGTSMAAPHVTGALALALAEFPDDSMDEILDRLYASVDPIPALEGKTRTGGRLNLANLLGTTAAPSSNDNFVDAYRFNGDYDLWTGSNRGATREPDEDAFSLPNTGAKSLWFAFHTLHSGIVTLDISADSVLHTAMVFEGGEKGSLKPIVQASPQSGASTQLRFTSKPNTEYRLLLDAVAGDIKRYRVSYNLSPPNDDFAMATQLSGDRFTAFGHNRASTAELFETEKPHAGVGQGRSVWWTWTAPSDLDFTISTAGSDFDTVLAVYTGSSPANLIEIASNDDRSPLDWTSQVTFSATAGITYYIAVDSFRANSMGDIILSGIRLGEIDILKHPESQFARLGDPVSMQVVALGTNLNFQWEFDGIAIPGEVSPTLRIQNTSSSDFGAYRVRVFNSQASIYSNPATLDERVTAPSILWQSRSRSLSIGDNITLRVMARGTGPLSYQWFHNDIELDGATSESLNLQNIDPSMEGGYTIVVSNTAGTITSERIVLRVFDLPWGNFDFVDPAAQSFHVYAIEYHDGIWVAASHTGDHSGTRISVSDDGRNWSHTMIAPDWPISYFDSNILAYGNGYWLAGGTGSGVRAPALFRSTNGMDWQPLNVMIPGSEPDYLYRLITQVVFFDGYFYMRRGGDVFRSTDGISWVRELSSSGTPIRASSPIVAGDPGLLVGGGNDTQAWFLNGGGGAWSEVVVNPANSGYSASFRSQFWTGSHFVVYSQFISTAFRSVDGVNWESGIVLPDALRLTSWRSTNGTLSLAGNQLSTDGGHTWTNYGSFLPLDTRAVALNSEGAAVFGSGKGALTYLPDILTPPDDYPTPMFPSAIDSLAYEGGQFIALHHDLTIAVSADGETWTRSRPKSIPFPRIGSGGSSGLAPPVAVNGEFWRPGRETSSAHLYPFFRGPVPGSSFPGSLPANPQDYLSTIVDGPLGVLAIRTRYNSWNAALVRSTDGGATWDEIPTPLTGLSKGGRLDVVNGHYVYYDPRMGINPSAISADLVNWTSLSDTKKLLFHQGEYWAFSQFGLRKSADLVNWSVLPEHVLGDYGVVASFNGALIATIGTRGRLHYSYDGIQWVYIPTPFPVAHLAASDDLMMIGSLHGHLVRVGASHVSAPVVRIIDPVEESIFVEGGRISVRVEAYHPDQDGEPLVRCFYDGILIGERTAPPYEFEIPSGGVGGHLIHAEARLGDGPVSLASRHVIIEHSHLPNRISGNEEWNALPGQIVYRNGLYIAHAANHFMGSLDGREWHALAMPMSINNPRGIVEGGGRIVAFGSASDRNIAVTSDGVNWQGVRIPLGSSTPIYFSHGYFWGVTVSGQLDGTFGSTRGVIFSEDGLNWNFRASRTNLSNFVAAAGNPNGILLGLESGRLWRSANGGSTWSRLMDLSSVNGLASQRDRFVARAVIGGQSVVGSSLDGLHWDWSAPDSRYQVLQVVDGTAFVFNTQNRLVAVSHDGLTWLQVSDDPRVSHLTRGADGFFHAVVTPAGASTPALYRSLNGLEWEYRAPLPVTGSFSMISTPEGLFISPGNGSVWILDWESVVWEQLFNSTAAVTSIRDVEAGGGMLLAIANNGTRILRSTDGGDSWLTSFDLAGSGLPNSLRLSQLMHLDGVWLAWHRGVALLHSEDGITFTNITANSGAATFGGLAHDGSQWMAIRDDGAIVTSTDGLAWTTHGEPGTYPDGRAFLLTSHLGVWYAISPVSTGLWNTRMLASADGLTWSPTSMPNLTSTGAVFFAAKGSEMIVGPSNARYTADLMTWTNTTANGSIFVHDGVFHQLNNGWLEKTENGTTWVRVRQPGTIYTRGKSIDGSIHLFGGSSLVILTGHDMGVHLVECEVADYAVGDTVDVTFTLTNEGNAVFPSGEYVVDVFLSQDGFHGNEDDAPMGRASAAVPELLPGESTTITVQAIIPNLTPPGDYHVGIYFDRSGARTETNRANNFGFSLSKPVKIAGWLLSTSALGDGFVSSESNQRRFANGSHVSLIATAGKGAVFTGWGGDANSPNNQITILMDGPKSVEANFSNRATLQVFTRGAGAVTGLADLGSYPVDATAVVFAEPDAGWEFLRWSGASSSTEPVVSVVMDRTQSLTAHFILPIEAWRNLHFTPEQLADPMISGDQMDPDGDGVPNWIEYLHGSDPLDASSTGRTAITLEQGYLRCIYTRNTGASGGTSIDALAGRDMVDWSAPDKQERILFTEDGIETVEIRLPMAGHEKGFIRFRYNPPENSEP